jgi:hypothetical protein
MPDIHPSCIYHFTGSLDALLSIVAGAFRVSYAREKIVGKRKSIEFAVPMVSFCDIRLSDIHSHISSYGAYGIGLTKDWAIDQGLNPVMYVSKNSNLSAEMIAEVKRIHQYIKEIRDKDYKKNARLSLRHNMNTLRYVKNYQGDLVRRSGKTTRDYRFASEREWRYVPSMDTIERPLLSIKDIESEELKAEWSSKLAGVNLCFEPSDVKYIIVKSDDSNERQAVITALHQHYGSSVEPSVQHLASRILSVDQIMNDI